MDVENSLTLSTMSALQAAAFVKAFLSRFQYDLTREVKEIHPELEQFRQDSGTLVLQDIPFGSADDFQKEYREIFLKIAHDVPDAPFLALARCRYDLESLHQFAYDKGILKRSYLRSDGSMDVWDCPECGFEFREPVSLSDVLDLGTEAICPNCGKTIFPEGSYRFTEEEIRLEEYFSFSDEDLKRALTFCHDHKPELEKDSRCGCFFCQEIFSPVEIEDWDTEDDNDRGTALCPCCDAPTFGYYTVIGESSGYPITADFLRQLNDYWKWEELQK